MNQRKSVAMPLVLIMLAMLSVFMIGCGKKTYSSVEEFFQDNPAAKSSMDEAASTVSGSEGTAKMEVSNNTVIVKLYYNEQVFGLDPQLDIQLKSQMDQSFSGAQSQQSIKSFLNEVSQKSGIDISLLSARYEMYNPGASTPSYTYTYPEQ